MKKIAELHTQVREIKSKTKSCDHWRKISKQIFELDELRTLFHQCPFTRRAYEKPRGYAVDAPTLDYIYGIETDDTPKPIANGLAAEISNCNLAIPATRAVRYRRRLLAGLVDEISRNQPNMRVLSVAAGHLREIEFSQAAKQSRIGAGQEKHRIRVKAL